VIVQAMSMRAAAAVGLVFLTLGLVGLAAAAPLIKAAELREELRAMRVLIAQRERLLLGGSPDGAQLLLAGETTGVQGADLQRYITELVEQNGMRVRSTQVVPDKRDASLTAIGLEANVQGQIGGLRALLYAIETGVPILLVDALAVKVATALQGQPARAVTLDVSLNVRGYGANKEAN